MTPAATRPPILAGVLVAVLAIGLAACGGGHATSSTARRSATAGPSSSSGSAGGSGGGGGAGGGLRGRAHLPGAFGKVAALTGKSMEVQNQQTGQVTVSWTTSTTFSETVSESIAAVRTGDCVTATGTDHGNALTATAVTVRKPTNGSCARGPGRFGARGSGRSRPPVAGGSGSRPSFAGNSGSRHFPGAGSAGGQAKDFGLASGRVTSVGTNEVVVSGFVFGGSAGHAPTSHSSVTSPPTTTVDIHVSGSTTFRTTKATTAKALAVGDCVTATGKAGTTGAVTASRVSITSTGGGKCTIGFGAGTFGG